MRHRVWSGGVTVYISDAPSVDATLRFLADQGIAASAPLRPREPHRHPRGVSCTCPVEVVVQAGQAGQARRLLAARDGERRRVVQALVHEAGRVIFRSVAAGAMVFAVLYACRVPLGWVIPAGFATGLATLLVTCALQREREERDGKRFRKRARH